MRRRALVAGLAASALLALTACAGEDEPAGPTPSGSITVLAAASLTESFEQIAEQVEREHPGTDVRLSVGGSSALATQVTQGAPADVLASASQAAMATAVDAGAAHPAKPFASNRLTIAVPPGNPGGVKGLADLASPQVSVALCQPEVPCGAAAHALLEAEGLTVRPVTEESDVRATLAKVRLGEVDAALVYVTDVRAAGDAVTGVEVPDIPAARTTYPIAVLSGSRNPALAGAFVTAVMSDAGQQVLADAGFSTP